MSAQKLHKNRRGMALLVVMVIVMLVSLAAYGFNQQMTDAYRISHLQIERTQARLTAMSAIEALKLSIQQPRGQRIGWHREAAESFAAIELEEGELTNIDDSDSVWSFSVLAPLTGSSSSETPVDPNAAEKEQAWRFGLSNESAKLNLAVLNEWEKTNPGQAKRALMNLPEMDASMADAIMRAYGIDDSGKTNDRRLSDRIGAFATEQAADGGSLLGQSDNSTSENSADGFARRWAWHWTGGDWNHDYQLDSLERALRGGSTQIAPLAWRDFLTFDSGQRNETLSGNARIFLNGNDLQQLHRGLMTIWTADQANFVIAYRQYGNGSRVSASDETTTISAGQWSPDFSVPAAARLQSSLELVGATVEISQSNGEILRIRSPFADDIGDRRDYLRALVDDVTVRPERVIDGQVDVNEAPREVLRGVPAMTPTVADRIVQHRESATASDASRDTIAWLLIENIIDLPTFKQMQPWITVGGDCYHAQIVSFRDPRTPTFRCTVTIDGRASDIATRHFQSWDAWGNGFSIDDLRGEPTP